METKLSQASHWAQILSFILALWLVLRPTTGLELEYASGMSIYMPYILPAALVLCILLAAGLHVLAAIIARRPPKAANDQHGECNKTIQQLREAVGVEVENHNRDMAASIDRHNALVAKLHECESNLKHWKGEAERERNFRAEQVEVRDQRIDEQGSRIANLEQQLRVSQDKAEILKAQFSTPKGWLKLKKVRYIAAAASGAPEKDLTEFFEDKFFEDGKLVIPPGLYRKLFGPLNDPALGIPKVLEIRFVHAGNEFSVLLPENISLTLPFPYAVTPEDVT